MMKQVRVYWNLHKNTWSIQHKTPKGWRVMRHADNVMLSDAKPKVYETGRQRVLQEQKKNVHSYLEGGLLFFGDEKPFTTNPKDEDVDYVSYNPYKAGHFVVKGTDEEWTGSSLVGMWGRTVVALKEKNNG